MKTESAGPLFRNRCEAGQKLAERLAKYRSRPDAIVLALPRGGVPVGFELARALNLPLDIFLVRKLGVPWQPELAMGAIATGGTQVLNHDIIATLKLSADEVSEAIEREERILKQRERLFRGETPPQVIEGRVVILVDDGLATGSSMRAAVAALRRMKPARIVIAVPVSSASTCAELGAEVEEMVCLATPEPFWAVGQWYVDFAPTTDEEVQHLLAQAREEERSRTL
jgi:putative phosphoribosyl transferase